MCQGCAQDFSLVKTEGPKIKAESAERRRRENRGAAGAEGVGCGEGVSPSLPTGGGVWGGGYAPSP